MADLFAEVGHRLRRELGEVALRIDHIGSTAVPGLDAKPVIDVQVSVASFEPLATYREPIGRAGFVHRADNPELTKRYSRHRRERKAAAGGGVPRRVHGRIAHALQILVDGDAAVLCAGDPGGCQVQVADLRYGGRG